MRSVRLELRLLMRVFKNEKKYLFKIGLKTCYIYGKLLPAVILKCIRAAYRRHIESDLWLNGDAADIVLNDQVFDSQLNKNLELANIQREGHSDAGSVNCRLKPHFSFENLTGLEWWLVGFNCKIIV